MTNRSYILSLVDAPALAVDTAGKILDTTPKFRAVIDTATPGRALADCTPDGGAALDTLFKRAARTSNTLPCALTFLTSDGETRLRGHCTRIEGRDTGPAYGLVFQDDTHANFRALNKQIAQLNAEVAKRQHAEKHLKETLTNNELLLRELHHRVKNNIQIQMALLDQQAAFANNEEFTALAERANQRLWALSQPLHVMYMEENYRSLKADKLFMGVINHLSEVFGDDVTIEARISDQLEIPNDRANTCALLLNELVTNAYKHGLTGKAGTIRVDVAPSGSNMVIEVRDPGKGIDAVLNSSDAFGLLLVRGLCQQIGAEFSTAYQNGGLCRVVLPGNS